MRRPRFALLAALGLLCQLAGCHFLVPEVSTMPVVHNPFPELSRVAVVPFFNQSDEPYVDGQEFALAYFAALQDTPGFEVVPVGVVEEAIVRHSIDLSNSEETRKLGRLLGVDAVVVGAVTDYTPYYPPRCGLRIEWYATNPGFHPIPPGYGLPWGTPEEEYIPDDVIFQAEMALARAQMATQSPLCPPVAAAEPPPDESLPLPDVTRPPSPGAEAPSPGERPGQLASEATAAGPAPVAGELLEPAAGLPPDWPDPRGFVPRGPTAERPPCVVHHGPVLTHTAIYHGHDPEFTNALASYVDFRDDARFGGWRSYLERSDDFVRFCCHLHLTELLMARGGSGETRVVERWPVGR